MTDPRRSWVCWAHALGDVTPCEGLVATELARLVDWRGEAIVSTRHLTEVTGRSRASVFRAVAGLERKGHLAVTRRRTGGHQAASLYRLLASRLPEVAKIDTTEPIASIPAFDSVGTGEAIARDDNDALREAVLAARASTWKGPVAHALAATALTAAPVQFSVAVRRARYLGSMSGDEAILDTATRAWEALVLNAEVIASARSPWAMWTRLVSRADYGTEADRNAGLQSVDPVLMPEQGLRPGQGDTGVDAVAVSDFEEVLGSMIAALVDAGMDETLAWAGTRRIAELALKGPSRRHTLAAEDVRLADLDVSPECARAWMTLLTGSRRGVTGGVVDLDICALRSRARDVYAAFIAA